MLAQITASMNMDTKKHKRPTIDQFYLYQPIDARNLPEARYGAAVKALIAENLFPSWALFCYKDLVNRSGGKVPELLCFKHEYAILIAPEETPLGYKGLLIAMEEVSQSSIDMVSPCGQQVKLNIPFIHTKIIAKEDVVLAKAY